MRNGLTLAGAGMAVVREALSKALSQLALAKSAVEVADADLADELDRAVAPRAGLQNRISAAARFEGARDRCREND